MDVADVAIRIILAGGAWGRHRSRARDQGAHRGLQDPHPGGCGSGSLHRGLVLRSRRYRYRPQPDLGRGGHRHRLPRCRRHRPLRRLGPGPYHCRQSVGGGRGGSAGRPGLLLGGSRHHRRGHRQPLPAPPDRRPAALSPLREGAGSAGALPVSRLCASGRTCRRAAAGPRRRQRDRNRTGGEANDTVHLLLDLPRGVDAPKLTALIADVEEVRTVRVE